jgi:hypothetical protein
MKHCVYSYLARCLRSEVAIFTMTWTHCEHPVTVATIEVRDRRIVQARGRADRALTAVAREHLRRWAAAAGLAIAP